MSTKRAAEQLGYPAVVLLIDRAVGRRYQAVAISVDGIEQPDFDPTIPDDLRATGWFWHGGWLTHYNEPPPKGCGVSVGMPLPSLAEAWALARKLASAGEKIAEARAAEEAKKASKPAKKPKEKNPASRPTERKATAPLPPPPAVVVVERPAAKPEQLALF